MSDRYEHFYGLIRQRSSSKMTPRRTSNAIVQVCKVFGSTVIWGGGGGELAWYTNSFISAQFAFYFICTHDIFQDLNINCICISLCLLYYCYVNTLLAIRKPLLFIFICIVNSEYANVIYLITSLILKYLVTLHRKATFLICVSV